MIERDKREQHVKLADARELFGPLAKLKLGIGNSSRTKCHLFTANGYFVVKTNTGDFKARAEGELWPAVELSMHRIKQLAKIYAKSPAPVRIAREKGVIRIDTTVIKTGE